MKATTPLPEIPLRHKNQACCVAAEPQLSLDRTATLASRLKALGDSSRLRILDLLVSQEVPMCVCDLTPHFEQNQPTISHHLRLLREAGLIDTEKRGIWSYYWATESGRAAFEALQALG